MKPLAEDYKNKLDEIAEALQNAEEYQQYLEEEEEEHYLALGNDLSKQLLTTGTAEFQAHALAFRHC
ncbi:MAG: hypothetical protein AAF146_16050, partial [Bacteroidota bacterium]